MDLQKEAFIWIINILRKNSIPFLISGGLAANAYGSTREIRDFDIEIKNSDFQKIMNDFKPYTISGPEIYKSRAFENVLLKLNFNGQEIDIAGGDKSRIYNSNKQEWVNDSVDFKRFENKEIFCQLVSVMYPEDVIAYKSSHPRPEDLIDIEAISKYLNSEKNFNWIISVLKKHNVRFVITGGLAAKSYGSPRPLNDIDIDIHDKDLYLILEDVKPYITFGPEQYKDERWDLLLMTLNHDGQDIDLSGGDTLKICDARTGKWMNNATNFSNTEEKEIFGLKVPVISKKDLVDYKSMLVGEHQQVDIQAVQNKLCIQ